MKCEYNDGLKVDYSGSLHVWNEKQIDLFMERDFISSNIKHDLDAAASENDCGKLRKIAMAVTDTVGTNINVRE